MADRDASQPSPPRRPWLRLDGTVPLVAVAMALFGALAWGLRLEHEVGELGRTLSATDARVEIYRESFQRRIERLEDRLTIISGAR